MRGGFLPPFLGLGPWDGAQVMSPRSPILRPGPLAIVSPRAGINNCSQITSTSLTLLDTNRLPAAPCFVELTISVSEDLLVATAHLVHRSYIVDRTVEPRLIVVPEIAVN